MKPAQYSPPPLQISFKFTYLTDPMETMLYVQFHFSESLWFMNYNKSKVVDFAKDSISLQGCSSVMLIVIVMLFV